MEYSSKKCFKIWVEIWFEYRQISGKSRLLVIHWKVTYSDKFLLNLIRYVLWEVSNFTLIFYVMSVLHKKSRQSLRPSIGRIGWDFFFKKGPNFEIIWPAPAMPRTQIVKGVYEVSYSWYGHIIGSVCMYIFIIWILRSKSSIVRSPLRGF